MIDIIIIKITLYSEINENIEMQSIELIAYTFIKLHLRSDIIINTRGYTA